MNFGQAIEALKAGKKVARGGWNGHCQALKFCDASPGHLPFISLTTAKGDQVPWTASQTDIVAEDWSEVADAAVVAEAVLAAAQEAITEPAPAITPTPEPAPEVTPAVEPVPEAAPAVEPTAVPEDETKSCR